MRLLELTVENFGVFRGRQQFNLEPLRERGGAERHLTIFSGHNGAGKSTLFQALGLALHGPVALGDRVSRQEYSDFLLSRVHRYSDEGHVVVGDGAGVELSFWYMHAGRRLRVRVERCWKRSARSVTECLNVLKDGQELDIDPAEYQNWLSGMIPPGLAALCFFDAERLDALADPEQHSALLGEILRRLLGLDLVERLQSDLRYYVRRQGEGRDVDQLRESLLEQQAVLESIDGQLSEIRATVETVDAERADWEAELARQERFLAAEGGRYASRRPMLKDRLDGVEEDLTVVTERLQELCAGLLPFALARKLCQALDRRLIEETEIGHIRAANQLWQEGIDGLEGVLQGDELWEDAGVPPERRQDLVERLTSRLRQQVVRCEANERRLVHHLAEPEREQLRGWIAKARHAVPEQVEALGRRLDKLQAEREEIKENLSRAPDDEVLAPIHREIMRLEEAIGDLEERRVSLIEEKGALEFQREEQQRRFDQLAQQLRDAQSDERELVLAERSQVALKAYEDALTRQRLGMLEEKLVTGFNAICRKEHLVTAVRISPDDFGVELQSSDGQGLKLDDLSTGERQLYALALLRALREVSGRQLPLAVDTPLARLDEKHRERFLREYVAEVSDQVVLFATEAELDSDLVAGAESFLARIYSLDYDSEQQRTVVQRSEYGP